MDLEATRVGPLPRASRDEELPRTEPCQEAGPCEANPAGSYSSSDIRQHLGSWAVRKGRVLIKTQPGEAEGGHWNAHYPVS